MTDRFFRMLVLVALTAGVAAPASAANKEHQQLMADIRMLQEQTQQLQNLIGQLGDAIKTVNTRIDDQSNALRKAFADQKLTIDTLSSDLRVVREKVDDNNVRISSLTQELDALRQSIAQSARPTTSEPDTGGAPGASPAPATAPSIGVSPTQVWEAAYSDYTGGRWALAIQGFEAYLRDFPKSDRADNAQVSIGNAYMFDNKYDKAVEAYDRAIRTYPNGTSIPEAYYKKGLALRHLGQNDKARESFDACIKRDPRGEQGDVAIMCKQALSSRQN